MEIPERELREWMRCLRDFYFGALEPAAFDKWLGKTLLLEAIIGEKNFFELIDVDYANEDEIMPTKELVKRIYEEQLGGHLIRDRVHDILDEMLHETIPLRAGCALLWDLRLSGATFIPAVFAGYASELDRTGDESFYRERILRDVREFIRDVED